MHVRVLFSPVARISSTGRTERKQNRNRLVARSFCVHAIFVVVCCSCVRHRCFLLASHVALPVSRFHIKFNASSITFERNNHEKMKFEFATDKQIHLKRSENMKFISFIYSVHFNLFNFCRSVRLMNQSFRHQVMIRSRHDFFSVRSPSVETQTLNVDASCAFLAAPRVFGTHASLPVACCRRAGNWRIVAPIKY